MEFNESLLVLSMNFEMKENNQMNIDMSFTQLKSNYCTERKNHFIGKSLEHFIEKCLEHFIEKCLEEFH